MTKNYDVSIAAITKTAPNDGSVDPYSVDYYRAQSSTAGTDVATMTKKKRGHVRWHRIETMLQGLGNLYISNKVGTGGTINVTPTTVTFRVTVEHDADPVRTADENNSGQFLSGALAIKRVIARALMSELTANQEVWDPSTVSGHSDVPTFGYRVISVVTGALAASITESDAAVTVTAVD